MAVGRQTIFKYKTVKGPLHKVPALLKFLLLLPLSVFFMSLSPKYLAAGIIAACVTAFFCKFTLYEQLTDLKPAAIYAVLMYGLSVFSTSIDALQTFPEQSFLSLLTPNPDFLRITLRLVLIIQLSSLLFRTTSSGELREGLRTLESATRRFFSKIFFHKKQIQRRKIVLPSISLFSCALYPKYLKIGL